MKSLNPINVAAAVIRRDNKILICSRKMPDQILAWEFPGGKLEPGENAGNALRRELLEELALEADILDILWMELLPDKPIKLIFIRTDIAPESAITTCEGQEFRWLPVKDLLNINLLPGDYNFAKYLLRCEKYKNYSKTP